MKNREYAWVGAALVAGLGAGTIATKLWADHCRRNPASSMVQRRVNQALDRVLRQARRKHTRDLDKKSRYVIFSDHHKGAGDPADDFDPCKKTYMKALRYYLEHRDNENDPYTLIILGDAEELWEQRNPTAVLRAHSDVFELESRFYNQGRYIRIHGNHDDLWKSRQNVRCYLGEHFPGIEFLDGLVFDYRHDQGMGGELFLVHGHQGTLDSDRFAFMGKTFLPLYRRFQNATHLGRTSPAEDDCLRAEHDTQMYRWAQDQGRLLLITGHTHRPVWSSRTHLESLLNELNEELNRAAREMAGEDGGSRWLGTWSRAALRLSRDFGLRDEYDNESEAEPVNDGPGGLVAVQAEQAGSDREVKTPQQAGEDKEAPRFWANEQVEQEMTVGRGYPHAARIRDLRNQVDRRAKKYPPCNDTVKTLPCYFNTGCCRFGDGDITGIELNGEVIRLVRWPASETAGEPVGPKPLETEYLSSIFAVL